MRLHETLARFADIIRTYNVVQYEVAGLHSRLKLKIVFTNSTELTPAALLMTTKLKPF
jgi:hypothetical protein